MSKVIFRPYFVQKGRGPHLSEFILAHDVQGDVFRSEITSTAAGIIIHKTSGVEKFSLSVRWNVEGYGYLYLPLDHGGEFYTFPEKGEMVYNLNYELLLTRVNRTRNRIHEFQNLGWRPSVESRAMQDIAANYLDQARLVRDNPEKCAQLSQTGLIYANHAGDLIEIEKARHDIGTSGFRPEFFFGCDSRGYFQMEQDIFLERFEEIFNYATITHYLIGDFVDFEPAEGKKQFKERDELLGQLRRRNITVEGRPLFWVHTWVTPEWMKKKTFDQILKYLETHIREVVSHYRDEIVVWEVVNEMHDWANEVQLNHEQTIELTRFACETARSVNPSIKLLINNCCPYADYVQKGKWHERDAIYPQRTPHQFTRQLIEADVEFDLIGVQVYFVKRTFAETAAYIERYREFDKQLHLAEVGSPSRGISQEFNETWENDFSTVPYEWRRLWDEELQADWLEYTFSLAYSKPYITAANWYDFLDPFGFLKSGGLLRSVKGEKKSAFDRLLQLKNTWAGLNT